jgi:hypothetical protein
MGRIEKEKNLYKFYVDGKEKPYTLDVNTGVMVGLRGTELSSIPPMVKGLLNKLWYHDGFVHTSVLRLLYSGDYRPQNHSQLYSLADKLDAIGYYASVYELSLCKDYLKGNEFPMKEFVKFLKEDAENSLREFIDEYLRIKWAENRGLKVDEHLTQPMVDFLYNRMDDSSYTKEDYQAFAYFLTRGLWDFMPSHYYKRDVLRDLWNWCRMLNKPMEKSDFYRQYINTKRAYEQRKNELLDTGIRNNQLAKKALAFENDAFEVIIPTTNAELIAEGENQHNCVGGYGERVAEGRTYVVFIRRKTAPTKAYITCEVSTQGRIWQYLAQYNRSVHDTDANEFYQAYQQHLSTHWGE